MGIRAARLPIRENMPGVTNQILNIDTALKAGLSKLFNPVVTHSLKAPGFNPLAL
jgi:hypothetical protein